ncbi:MAG: AAA family ATPase [Nitrospiraceae bacterium]|nr:AAA family ATPase [Nitrospiraceae bacterium]
MANVLGDQEVRRESDKDELKALKKLGSVFKNDNNVVLYFKPTIPISWNNSDLNPDILWFHPRIGCVVVEVKGWSLSFLKNAALDKSEQFIINGKAYSNPLKEVRRFAEGFLDLSRVGKSRGPVSYILAFPNLTSSDYEKLPPYIKRHIPKDRTIFLFESDEDVKSKVLNSVSNYVNPKKEEEIMKSMEKLRKELFPHINIPLKDKRDMALMDLVQESILYRYKKGYHVVRGGPGTGKTVILIGKALKEALEDTRNGNNRRIGIVSFTNSIVERIKEDIEEIINERLLDLKAEDIVISNLHSLAADFLKEMNIKTKTSKDIVEKASNVIEKVGTIPEEMKFDILLVDEAQDFKKSWFKFVKYLLKDDGLVIFGVDETQRIYNHANWKWKDTPFPVRGRQVSVLRKIYRTSQNILEIGIKFLMKDPVLVRELKELDAWVDVNQLEFLERKTLIKAETGNEFKLIEKTLSKLLKEGYKPKDILILTPFYDQNFSLCPKRIGKFIQEKKILRSNEINTSKKLDKEKLSILTYHSAKGLENKCVIVTGLDKVPFLHSTTAEEKRRDRRLVYVAITRAQERLYLIGRQKEGYFKELTEIIEN